MTLGMWIDILEVALLAAIILAVPGAIGFGFGVWWTHREHLARQNEGR